MGQGRYGRNEMAIRIVAILRVFERGGRLTLFALAERFGVSPRTVRRDLEALQAAGVPLTNEGSGPGRGNRGEWWLCR